MPHAVRLERVDHNHLASVLAHNAKVGARSQRAPQVVVTLAHLLERAEDQSVVPLDEPQLGRWAEQREDVDDGIVRVEPL